MIIQSSDARLAPRFTWIGLGKCCRDGEPTRSRGLAGKRTLLLVRDCYARLASII